MTVVAYTRVSTLDQASSGLGLESQAAAIRDFAIANWPKQHLLILSETGSGCSLAERPVLSNLLEHIEDFTALIALRISRIARNTRDFLNIVDRCRAANVRLQTIHERIDTETAAGQMLVTIIAAAEQYVLDVNHDQTIEALERKRARGEHLGRWPRGIAHNGQRPPPADLYAVQRLYALTARGRSVREAARIVGLAYSSARYILANPIYRDRHLLRPVRPPDPPSAT